MIKTINFTDLPGGWISLDCEYSADPEDMTIELEDGWEKKIIDFYDAQALEAIKHIKGEVQNLLFDNAPLAWAEEEKRLYDEMIADSMLKAQAADDFADMLQGRFSCAKI